MDWKQLLPHCNRLLLHFSGCHHAERAAAAHQKEYSTVGPTSLDVQAVYLNHRIENTTAVPQSLIATF